MFRTSTWMCHAATKCISRTSTVDMARCVVNLLLGPWGDHGLGTTPVLVLVRFNKSFFNFFVFFQSELTCDTGRRVPLSTGKIGTFCWEVF